MDKTVLDGLVSDRILFMERYDLHAYAMNSKGIALCGITASTAVPAGGSILIENGVFQGVVFDTAVALAFPFLPQVSLEASKQILLGTMNYFISLGITGFMDAMVTPSMENVYKALYSDPTLVDQLPRAFLSVGWNTFLAGLNDDKKKALESYRFSSNKLNLNTVKFFIDGVVSSRTALLHEPYLEGNDTNTGGPLTFSAGDLETIFTYLNQAGWKIHTHCFGDLAVSMTLDALEKAKAQSPQSRQLHYIAHNYFVIPSDIDRYTEIGVGANFSPFWFSRNPGTNDTETVMGPERMKNFQPIRKVSETGAVVGLGSDWSVTSCVPVEEIQVGATHLALTEPTTDSPYHPDNILEVGELVKMFTAGSAKLVGAENVGKLKVGYKADIVVLDKNIFEIEKSNIHTANVLLSIIDGKVALNKLNN